MPLRSTFSACSRLGRVPNPRKFPSDEGMGRDGFVDNHASRTDVIEDALGESVASERVDLP